jgi:hypothetical protein
LGSAGVGTAIECNEEARNVVVIQPFCRMRIGKRQLEGAFWGGQTRKEHAFFYVDVERKGRTKHRIPIFFRCATILYAVFVVSMELSAGSASLFFFSLSSVPGWKLGNHGRILYFLFV